MQKMFHIKKCVFLLIIIYTVLTLCGCKSAAVRKTERLIKKIGTVTIESKAEIDAAQSAYNALSDADRIQVSGINDLLLSVKTYNALLVTEKINSIGTVTEISKNLIEDATKSYNALSDEEKSLVINYETLEKAISIYSSILLDQFEKDNNIDLTRKMLETVADAFGYSKPMFTLDRKSRTYYCDITMSNDAYDAVVWYPALAKGLLNQIGASYADVCSELYKNAKPYNVDVVIRLNAPAYYGSVLEIKNGTIVYSML